MTIKEPNNNSRIDAIENVSIKDVLVVDFVGTSPSYTAHFSDALNRHGLTSNSIIPWDHKDLVFLSNLKVNYASKRKYATSSLGKVLTYLAHWRMILSISEKYKAIHFQWFPLLAQSRLDLLLIKKLLQKNANIYFTVHNILPHDNSSNKARQNYQLLYDIFPHLVVHTEKTKADLCSNFNVKESKIIRINHGPMFSYFSNIQLVDLKSKLKLGIIGFIKPYKGIEQALELTKKAIGTDFEFELIIRGSGKPSYIDVIDKKISELGLEKHVHFNVGYLELRDYIDIHNQLDCVLAPYRHIDQSGAVISALSLGKPVLGFAIGGIAELIKNKVNGYLVPPENIESLFDGIGWLKSTNKFEIFKQCQASLESISWEHSAEKLSGFYRKKPINAN